MSTEERLERLEKAVLLDERLTRIEYRSIRFTAFLLLELGLLALVAWSVFHLVHFVRSSAL
jgi:hypothetical protein